MSKKFSQFTDWSGSGGPNGSGFLVGYDPAIAVASRNVRVLLSDLLAYFFPLSAVRTITTSAAILAANSTVLGNAILGAITGTLPTAVGVTGKIYILKKVDVSANAFNIASTGGQTFDGQASPYSLTIANETLAVQSDGANWIILWHF